MSSSIDVVPRIDDLLSGFKIVGRNGGGKSVMLGLKKKLVWMLGFVFIIPLQPLINWCTGIIQNKWIIGNGGLIYSSYQKYFA